jgi:isopentenyl-diphosphate delta-isomerase
MTAEQCWRTVVAPCPARSSGKVVSVLYETEVEERVVLVDERGNPIGEQSKSAVHHARTPLHLAFSLYLFDADGRLLMTRRALSKLTWPGVWTNSCCGHPMPGESMPDAVTRRLAQETGLQVTDLREVLPDFAYRVQDVSGIWENEICPVYVGTVVPAGAADQGGQPLTPNPDEVMDWTWVDRADIARSMARTPFAFSPWAVLQMERLVADGAALHGVPEGAR